MYAVIEANGRQLKVKEGDVVRLDRIGDDADAQVVFERVVLAHDGTNLLVGLPTVKGAHVTASVIRQAKAPKILAFRYKPKKRVRRKHGHRQPVTDLRIDKIVLA